MLENLSQLLWTMYPEFRHHPPRYRKEAKTILDTLESKGMRPPNVKAKDLREEDFPWGGGCSSRCICNECDPNFIMNEWENE